MEFKVGPGDVVVCDKYTYALLLDDGKMLVCVENLAISGHFETPKVVPLQADIFPIKPSEIKRIPWSHQIVFSAALLVMNKPSFIPEPKSEVTKK